MTPAVWNSVGARDQRKDAKRLGDRFEIGAGR